MELELRNINLSDYNQYKQHINSNFTFEYFENFLKNLLNENHVILIVKKNNNIIASGTLLIEEKLTYNGCKLGHIENIFVNECERGKKIGSLIIKKLVEIANYNKCYRVDLCCDDSLVKFYEKLNFIIKKQNTMSLLLPNNFSK